MEEWPGRPLRSWGWPQVVEWRQVGDAAVTDFVRPHKMNLVLDDPKKEGKGMCPCHQV